MHCGKWTLISTTVLCCTINPDILVSCTCTEGSSIQHTRLYCLFHAPVESVQLAFDHSGVMCLYQNSYCLYDWNGGPLSDWQVMRIPWFAKISFIALMVVVEFGTFGKIFISGHQLYRSIMMKMYSSFGYGP